MTAVLSFADDAGGGTLYRAQVLHADSTGKTRHEAMGFHGGWGAAAAQLDALAVSL